MVNSVPTASNVVFEPDLSRRKPAWIRTKVPSGGNLRDLRQMMGELNLHTVCESAKCPNLGECWSHRTATLMILGDVCTRSCGFCAVKTGRPAALDTEEPLRVAQAVQRMGLRHAVITSVNRDELPDGGANLFAATIRAVRERNPRCAVEVLIPDFMGNWDALDRVIRERPDILNHNTETVPRLYKQARPQAKYPRTLELLRRSKAAGLLTKTGLMVGLGETFEELTAVMDDLIQQGCDILTIGQYLQPTPSHLPIARYYTPEEFDTLRAEGRARGFAHVESGVFVRSSYHAWSQADAVRQAADPTTR